MPSWAPRLALPDGAAQKKSRWSPCACTWRFARGRTPSLRCAAIDDRRADHFAASRKLPGNLLRTRSWTLKLVMSPRRRATFPHLKSLWWPPLINDTSQDLRNSLRLTYSMPYSYIDQCRLARPSRPCLVHRTNNAVDPTRVTICCERRRLMGPID